MIVVIISGGAGSRLWPVSRQSDPKPFIKLADGLSLLQNTFKRATKLPDVTKVVTVTNKKIFFRMQDEYQQVNNSSINCDYILEPFGRNTAPAVLLACLMISQSYTADEKILVLPADHLVSDFANFNQAVKKASDIADLNYLVTFGINPEYPETGYGYIEFDKSQQINGGYAIKRFVEKPDLDNAKKYAASDNYLWNSGMFLGRVDVFLAEFSKYAEELVATTTICLANSLVESLNNGKVINLDSQSLLQVENISIDYSLFEKSTKVSVVPCSIGWSDIGSWLSIAQTLPKDNNGNSVIGESVLHNTQNCLIYSTDRIIAGVDINDLIIVDTPDAVLVADKHNSQNVKHIFERLKKIEHQTFELHQTVHRPWGTYTILEEGPFYKIKRIEVKPHCSLSLQMHDKRSEHWVVVTGTASIINGREDILLHANESTYIPIGTKHRLSNITDSSLVLIEVQCGSYLGEDDIVRFEDDYGRDV